MNYKPKNRDILYNDAQLGPFPDHLLKRVDKLTVEVMGPLKNFSHSDSAASKVLRGEFGENVAKERKRIIQKIPYGAAFFDIRNNDIVANNTNKNPVAATKAPLPDDPRAVARHIKSFGYFMGADQMGICRIPEGCTFTDDEKGNPIDMSGYTHAIVFLKRKHYDTCAASDGRDFIFDSCSHQVYQQLAGWANTMADYIRRLGYEAEASTMRNYVNLMTPLILACGMGESSRMGIALSPFFGANFKTSAVLTTLPMECDKPIDFGLQEYCRNCSICAEVCPCHAISYQTEYTPYHGYQSWGMVFEKCAVNNSVNPKGSVCGRCTIVCPWNRPDSKPEDFRDWDGSVEWLHDKVNKRAEYLRAHDLKDERQLTEKWWFDFEEKFDDGVLYIPDCAEIDIIE